MLLCMTNFTPVTLSKGDRTVVAHSRADLVQYEFDGFRRTHAEDQPVSERTPSYRELQARAKELDIPATGSYDELEASVAEAEQFQRELNAEAGDVS